jgi:hypothetical protein
MEKYDYRKAVMDDIREYINENDIRVTNENRQELDDELYDKMFVCDSVTGNASGSYTFNAWKAEEYLCHNLGLLADAIEEFGADDGTYKDCIESAETADVTIRCYLLRECLSSVLDDLEEDVNELDDIEE